jgi:hypothetical protein
VSKEEFIKAIEEVDITNNALWWFDLIEKLDNKYAKGYLTCKAEHVGDVCSPDEPMFREEILDACQHDIWDDK